MKHIELLAIPDLQTATDPILSDADLRQRWRALMGPLGFGERLLRFVLVGADRRFMKALVDIPVPAAPDRAFVGELMASLSDLLAGHDPGTTVAFLLSRPGLGDRPSHADRRWASVVTEFAADFNVPVEPIFRANDESLIQIAA